MFLLLPDCQDFVNSSNISRGGGGGSHKDSNKTWFKKVMK